MTKNEMLLKLLAQSGWIVTNEVDADGYVKCVAADNENERAE